MMKDEFLHECRKVFETVFDTEKYVEMAMKQATDMVESTCFNWDEIPQIAIDVVRGDEEECIKAALEELSNEFLDKCKAIFVETAATKWQLTKAIEIAINLDNDGITPRESIPEIVIEQLEAEEKEEENRYSYFNSEMPTLDY